MRGAHAYMQGHALIATVGTCGGPRTHVGGTCGGGAHVEGCAHMRVGHAHCILGVRAHACTLWAFGLEKISHQCSKVILNILDFVSEILRYFKFSDP